MDLNILWFILVTVLFCGFFFLEGFDYGVGILLPFIAKKDNERRAVINTIGPVWDGNEVWMITAGGAMFAAFPHMYATLFSGFYVALVIMLLGLIIRGVAFEFRSKRDVQAWRNRWDWAIFIGSLVPALLWGVTVANLIRGIASLTQPLRPAGRLGFPGLIHPSRCQLSGNQTERGVKPKGETHRIQALAHCCFTGGSLFGLDLSSNGYS
jgi:cytochrome d ubiquinol oxidase subunit II